MTAVLDVISEVGYERTTVDAIAARAHASKATIYRRWGGKAELVADVLRRHAEGEAPDAPNTGSIRSDLLANAKGIMESIESEGGPSFLGMIEGIRDDRVLRDLVRGQILAASERSGNALIEHAHARNNNIRAELVPTAFHLMVSQLVLDALLQPDEAAEPSYVRLVDDIVLPLLTEGTGSAAISSTLAG